MMKKRLVLGTTITLGLLVTAASIHAFAADVSGSRAKAIALEHAKVTEDDLIFSKVEKDYEDRRLVYEVEFVTEDGAEYDYEIEAATGSIIKYDYDAEYYAPARRADAKKGSATELLTLDEAKEIVLKRAGITEKQAKRLFMESDWDDGRVLYEGEFYYNEMEYEFELDAQSRIILEWEVESIYD